MKTRIIPSILAADFSHLQKEVDSVASADGLQIDVMDGHFVPNLSFGAEIIEDLKTNLPFDVHLMVQNPADRIQEFLDAKAQNITFHAEAVRDTKERKKLIESIHKGGATAGIAINPDTPIEEIEDVLEVVDLVLVMSVHPGFSGQLFIPDVLKKVREVRNRFSDLEIQMDGGITVENAAQCREAGANNLVAASAIFGVEKEKREELIAQLRGEA